MNTQALTFKFPSYNSASKASFVRQLAFARSRNASVETRTRSQLGPSSLRFTVSVFQRQSKIATLGAFSSLWVFAAGLNFILDVIVDQYRWNLTRSGLSDRMPGSREDDGKQTELPEAYHKGWESIAKIFKNANSYIPHVVVASTLLALMFPPSFSWFTNRYYAPALGFLMFAVGINSNAEDFVLAMKRPGVLWLGYIGQFLLKPLLGFIFGNIALRVFHLPEAIGSGLILTSCVSGAQLSNYATYLTEPALAPLSIVMTALSTATAVVVTPLLTLFLLGKRLPVDVKGMMSSITQIVVVPIAAGLLMNKFVPKVCAWFRPFLPPMSVLVTALCVGAPLAANINAIRTGFGLTILIPVVGFHAFAFLLGYRLAGISFPSAPDKRSLQRTISFETGMQSSLLGLALANKFFQDPLVGVPSAISVVVMSLMGFALVVIWREKKHDM